MATSFGLSNKSPIFEHSSNMDPNLSHEINEMIEELGNNNVDVRRVIAYLDDPSKQKMVHRLLKAKIQRLEEDKLIKRMVHLYMFFARSL